MSVAATAKQEKIERHGYARQRLLLGVTAVGSMVLFSVAMLVTGAPRLLAEALPGWAAVAMFFAIIAILHAGFDFLGGYVLPRRVGRLRLPLKDFARRWVRGAFLHTLVLMAIGALMLLASALIGRAGFVSVTAIAAFMLLWFRLPLAGLIGTVRPDRGRVIGQHILTEADDEGFTGGIIGVIRPRGSLLPAHWFDRLPSDSFNVVARRRTLAVATGSWRRGRLMALGFILLGGVIAAAAVPEPSVGSGAGVIYFSLLFTLWSFAGLLVLPSLSRAAAARLDAAALQAGVLPADLEAAAGALDRLQDDEPKRSKWIERIFHPIPSVRSRAAALHADTSHAIGPGAWDIARTTIFLSWSGLSLLSRSVHCNCGRPDLWVFLPSE